MYLIPPTRSFGGCHIGEAVLGHRGNGGIFLTEDHDAVVLDRVKVSASLVAPFRLFGFLMLTTTTRMIVRESTLMVLAPLLDPEYAIHSLGSRDSANSPPAKMDQQQSQPSALLCRHDQDDSWWSNSRYRISGRLSSSTALCYYHFRTCLFLILALVLFRFAITLRQH